MSTSGALMRGGHILKSNKKALKSSIVRVSNRPFKVNVYNYAWPNGPGI